MNELVWTDEEHFTIAGTRFECGERNRFKPHEGHFYVFKSPAAIRHYVRLLESIQARRIVELGTFHGGSTAMVAALCDPEKLVGVDITEERIAELDAFIEEQALSGRVEVHHSVDQGNRAQLGGIIDAAFGDEPLDIVFDDASHQLVPTRTSFELLFPRLRPGGLYVLEDWRVPALQILACQLTSGLAQGLASDITMRQHALVIRRSNVVLDDFALDHFVFEDLRDGFATAGAVWTPERYQAFNEYVADFMTKDPSAAPKGAGRGVLRLRPDGGGGTAEA